MIVQRKSFQLMEPGHPKAEFCVDPAGLLEVDCSDGQRCYMAEFNSLQFRPNEQGTLLVCKSRPGWQLQLRDCDAQRLKWMVEIARDEFGALMRDL
ncbi:hypothetical protein [Ferrimonas gelatinilytica]|uniref:Uncharacterized protein n=1 Tax=Ferrimonas gelatinilytica TaxID=1255257 RepID=A0ABP9SCR5_9GAMM